MLPRAFHSSARSLLRWVGYPIEQLPSPWQEASVNYGDNGAKAVNTSSPYIPVRFCDML